MKLDLQTLALLFGTVVPLVVGLITKSSAPRWLKAATNAVLSALTAVLALSLKSVGVDANTFINTFLVTFISSAASYYGFHNPSGLAGYVQNITGNVGIGPGPGADPAP